MDIVPVILSGGSGTRLWPLSRAEYPKQFLKLTSDFTMIQETIKRLEKVDYISDVKLLSPIVVCNNTHRFIVADQLREIGVENPMIMLEPVAKNTAPAIAAVCFEAQKKSDNPIIVVLASDHVIKNTDAFVSAVEKAAAQARKGSLVTFGIKPTAPETGYGYIKTDKSTDSGACYKIDKFVEKPNLEKAKEYLADGSYYWNSGMFVFEAEVFLSELKKFNEEIYNAAKSSVQLAKKDLDFIRLDKDCFSESPSDSIDYAVMEKTDKGMVVPLDADWSDVGSWSALWDVNPKDSFGNVTHGEVIAKDCSDSYFYSQNRLIAALGVKDVVVVETKDAILVADKKSAQNIKSVVDELKSKDHPVATKNRVGHRPWGCYDSIEKGERYKVKHITVKPGAKLSVQMHYHRSEHWIIVSGTAKVRNGDKELILCENESTYIPVGAIHALENPGKVPLELIEVQSGSYLEEDDIVRFEDCYGRV